MPAEHFTRDDLLGIALATALFAFLLIPPGYVIGWLFDLLGFRKLTWWWRISVSVVLSISVCPILIFLLWSYVSLSAVWALYACCFAAFVALAISMRKSLPPGWVALATLLWLGIVWASTVDLQTGHRLYTSILSYDFNLRSALVDGLGRNGLPARNPLFYPGHAVPLRYHYFWLLLCALVDLAGGRWVDARHALMASDVWCGWALMALVALYLRFLHPAGMRGVESRIKWGVGMLAIAGLDILPSLDLDVIYALTRHATVYPSVAWWNDDVPNLLDSALWVPHHVSSMIACLAGFLILWLEARGPRLRPFVTALCAGLCLSSAVGLSVYASFAFELFLAGWGAWVLYRGNWPERSTWMLAGVVALVCSIPYLHSIQSAGGPGGPFASFAVRDFRPVDIALSTLGLTRTEISFANLLALPLNYFLEAGMWFVLAAIWGRSAWKRRRNLPKAEQAACAIFLAALFVGSFVCSGVIGANDLGLRATGVGQFILLIWSVDHMRAWWRMRRNGRIATAWCAMVSVLAIVGLSSTLYEFAILRAYLPLADAGITPKPWWFTAQPGRRTYDARQIYSRLRESLPANAVLQGDPTQWNDVFHGLYAMRQTASFDAECGSVMGGVGDCAAMQAQIAPLFQNLAAARTADIDAVCHAWGIDVLIAKDQDPVFADHSAWPWKRTPLAANERVRAIPCGASAGLSKPLANVSEPMSR